jgi:hypothetical protein
MKVSLGNSSKYPQNIKETFNPFSKSLQNPPIARHYNGNIQQLQPSPPITYNLIN